MIKFTRERKVKRKILLALSMTLFLSNVGVNAQTYCTPAYSTGCAYSDDIHTFTLTGANATSINQSNTGCSSGAYMYYSSIPTVSVITGNTYSGTINSEYSSNENIRIWIDFNNNGTFESTESVGTLANFGTTLTNYSISIPATAATGSNLRMRVRCAYYTTPSTIDPCTSYTYGETHDYNVNVLPPAPPNNAGVGSLITPTSDPFCSNSYQEVSVSVINLGSNALTSAEINWSVDGVLQTPVTLPVTLPNFKDSTTVVLGNAFYPTTAPIQIKAWTNMPNGVADADHSDDTLSTPSVASLLGVDVAVTPNDTIICNGAELTLDAGTFPNNPIYIWNTGSLSHSISVSTEGTYIVKVQNTDGCFDRDTVVVEVHPNPTINSIAIIDNDQGNYTFNVIGAHNITYYAWDFGDGTSGSNYQGSGSPSQIIHQYSAAGQYNVVLTISNDCGDRTVTKLVQTNGVTTGIGNVTALQRAFSVFPNPAKTTVAVSNNDGIKINSVTIFNLMGQKVFEQSEVGTSKAEITVSNLAAGIYNMVIDSEEGKLTKKLEVIH